MFIFKKITLFFFLCFSLPSIDCCEIEETYKAHVKDKQTIHLIKHSAAGLGFGMLAAASGLYALINTTAAGLQFLPTNNMHNDIKGFKKLFSKTNLLNLHVFNSVAAFFILYQSAKAAKNHFAQLRKQASS